MRARGSMLLGLSEMSESFSYLGKLLWMEKVNGREGLQFDRKVEQKYHNIGIRCNTRAAHIKKLDKIRKACWRQNSKD